METGEKKPPQPAPEAGPAGEPNARATAERLKGGGPPRETEEGTPDAVLLKPYAEAAAAKPPQHGELVYQRQRKDFTELENRLAAKMEQALANDPQVSTNAFNRESNQRCKSLSEQPGASPDKVRQELQAYPGKLLAEDNEARKARREGQHCSSEIDRIGDDTAAHIRRRAEGFINSGEPGTFRETVLPPDPEGKRVLGQVRGWTPAGERSTPWRSEWFIPAREMEKLLADRVIDASGTINNQAELRARFALPPDNGVSRIGFFQVTRSTQGIESVASPRWIDASKGAVLPGGGLQIAVFERENLKEVTQCRV